MDQPFNSSIDMGAAVEKQSRSRSPIARNKAVDEASDTYRQAMDKVYEASWKFDRGKNGDFLKVGQLDHCLSVMIHTACCQYNANTALRSAYFRPWTTRSFPFRYFVKSFVQE